MYLDLFYIYYSQTKLVKQRHQQNTPQTVLNLQVQSQNQHKIHITRFNIKHSKLGIKIMQDFHNFYTKYNK
jgi:hypothetical protein